VTLGTIFGLASKSNRDEADALCSGSNCYSQSGVDARSDATRNCNLSTVAFLIGAASLAGGTVLWFTASRDGGQKAPAAQLRLGPAIVALNGSW
jgi:hypothetical protein